MGKTALSVAASALAAASFAYDLHNPALTPVEEGPRPAGAAIRLVEGGKVNFAVVADTKTEGRVKSRSGYSIRPAIAELTNAFARCFGAVPEVCDFRDEAAYGKAKYVVYLGDQPFVREMGIDCRSLPSQGFRLTTFRKGLVIAGNDSSLVPGYNSEKYECLGTSPGTLNGVLDFCERFLDVRWYFPGPYGSLFPKQSDLAVEPVDYTDGPYFNERQELYMLTMQTSSKKLADKWSKYLGYPVKRGDGSFGRYLRIGGTIPPVGMHCPNPARLIRNFPDRTKLMFYTSANGRHWCNEKNPELCYFNVFDLKFADFLVDEVYRPYFESKGKVDLGGLAPYVSKGYVSFGQCDNKLSEADWRADPVVKELGLKSMADVYCRFQQYLANRIATEFPGTRLFVLAYYDQQCATEDPRWKLPENFDVMLCAGNLPRRTRRPDQLEGTLKRFREWYEASGNHPISKVWLYTDNQNPFSISMIPEFTGEVPGVLGKYMGRDGCFLNYTGADLWHYFWCPYVSFRSQWNPKFDVDAAIDEMWLRMFGSESGAHMAKFHKLVKQGYLDHYLDGREVYPPELIDEIERELNAGGACLAKDSAEYRRWKLVADYWPKAFAQQRVRAAYTPPAYDAPKLAAGESIVVDGVAEAAWDKADAMPLSDCADPTKKTQWPTAAKIRWDEKGIYFLAQGDWDALVVPEEDMWKENDMIEVFLSPGLGQEVLYQFAWDFTGRYYACKKRFLPVVQPADTNWRPPLSSKTTYGDGKWTFEAFVPYDNFDDVSVPKAGEEWNANIVRDKTERGRPAYEPVDMVSSSFTMGVHSRRAMYGTVRFVVK
ncbi:MAG: DUF4838 domain-containing protein [Kiritimatiellae bacterium]|nr:DUF4838 domain-containing protein [Kiritimatiellia bacterium]